MASFTKKHSDMLGSAAVEALQLAVPLAKAIPFVGDMVEDSLWAALYIIQAKDEVKMKKEQCQILADCVVTITATITAELMNADPATLARRENGVAALRGTLRGIQTLLQQLASALLVPRVLKCGEVDDKLSLFRDRLLGIAIGTFRITKNMQLEVALTRLLEVIKEREDERDIFLLKSLLRPVVTASYLVRPPDSGCFTGTRKALLDQISTWFDNPRAPLIFWLSGLAGTGKTAVSHTVCEKLHVNGRLGASFFFSRNKADRRRVASIIPTLAFQLASVNPTYRRKLRDVLKAHPDAPSRAQQYQLRELLLVPLKEVPSLPPYLIILDALDECDKERGMEGGDLIPLIFRELPNSGLNIRVLITSRPERSIRDAFKVAGHGMKMHETSVLHDMDESVVKEDIASYLAYHLQRIRVNRNIAPPWPGDKAFNDLVTSAGLFFCFAATIINFVGDPYYSPQTQLQQLLESRNTQSQVTYNQVDLLYLQILTTFVGGRANASELCAQFRKFVGAIILLQNPLSISALAHLLEHDEADLEGALSWLHSLLDIPSNHDEPVCIFHPSFRDFLLIRERHQDGRFTVPEGRTHAQLALHCLKIMLRHLKRNICGISNDTVPNSEIPDLKSRLRECVPPALLYACQHWGDHLSQSANDTDLQEGLVEVLSEFASTKLLYWVEVLSLEGRFPLCVSNLVAVTPWCKVVDPTIFHLMYDAYRLVLRFHDVINISAMQVYHSALVFSPKCPLLRAYEHELPMVHRAEGWDASLLVLKGHRSSVNMVSFSRKGSYAASASDDGYIRVWDTSNGAQVSCFEGHDGAVKSVEYSPDSSYILSGGFDATIRIWDAITGVNISTLIGHKGTVNSVTFSSDGRNIASGSEDYTLRIWDTLANEPLTLLNGHFGPVTCVTFVVDNSQILSGSMDSTIRLWDMKTGDTLKILYCTDAVLSLAVSPSPQNPIFLSGSQNGAITIRDLVTLIEIERLVGAGAAIKSVAFSPQGNKVVSGSLDGTIHVWNVAGRSCVAEYRGHSGPVECTRFTPDGTRILSSSADRTIRLWDASIEGVRGSKDSVMTVLTPNHIEHIVSGSSIQMNGPRFDPVSQRGAVVTKVDKSTQIGDVHMKVYADSEVQVQLDPQLSLLTILREKKPGSPIGCVVNVATIDLARSLLTTKNYVNAASQLTGVSDTELLLDFMLYLLCRGHLSCSEVPDANRRARRLMLKMITKTPVTPSSLFVKGINAKVDYDCIGRGGFGFVFKGELKGAAVALKLLYKTRHNDDFCREALMWRSLNHERVLPFLGIFKDDLASLMFLVSPYMKNGTLSQWRKKANHSTLEIQRLILEVAEGIQYIHSEGIVHGDLCGDNVLLDSHFHAQIADFGLTRHSEATVTKSGAVHYNFAAPELLGSWDEEEDVSESDDDGQLTTRTQKSDVYAFGCLYYEIQFDTIPFQGMKEIQIMRLVSLGKRPPRLEKPSLSDKAWKLIKQCWAKEVVRRPAMEGIVEKIMAWESV